MLFSRKQDNNEKIGDRISAELLDFLLLLDELRDRRVPVVSRAAVAVEVDHGGREAPGAVERSLRWRSFFWNQMCFSKMRVTFEKKTMVLFCIVRNADIFVLSAWQHDRFCQRRSTILIILAIQFWLIFGSFYSNKENSTTQITSNMNATFEKLQKVVLTLSIFFIVRYCLYFHNYQFRNRFQHH